MEPQKKKLNRRKPVFALDGLLPCMLIGRKNCKKCEVCTRLVTAPLVEDDEDIDWEQELYQQLKSKNI